MYKFAKAATRPPSRRHLVAIVLTVRLLLSKCLFWPVSARLRTLLVTTTLLVTPLLSYPVAATAAETDRTILVMGDSISAGYGIQREQGWVHLLQQQLQQAETAWNTINASISGETTGGGRARMGDLLRTHSPNVVLLELGGNDGLRGYPVNKIRDNLLAMVEQVKAQDAIAVIMAMRIPPNYGPRYTQQFDAVFSEVAKATDSLLVPFFLNDVALEPGMMQADGIHPTAEAQPIMATAVSQALADLLNTSAAE